MKYVKKIAAIFCAVMMVVTINASVVNAASTDEGNPTVITLISVSYTHLTLPTKLEV